MDLCLLAITLIISSVYCDPFTERIFGGEDIEPNQYPFLVAMTILEENFNYYLKGGALISNVYVLTSAQYLNFEARAVEVSLGAHDLADQTEDDRIAFLYTTDDLPEVLILHEHFDSLSLANNIALIKLRGGVEYGNKIRNVELPSFSLDTKILTDTEAMIVGWGIDEESQFNTQFPKRVNVSIIAPKICDHFYPSQNRSLVLCSDGENKVGACRGDEGTILFTAHNEGSPKLIGLVSAFSTLGCDARWPTVFTNVAGYVDWINAHAQPDRTQRI